MARRRRTLTEKQNHYGLDETAQFCSNFNTYKVTALGQGLSYARPGQGRNGHQYNPLQIEGLSLHNVILEGCCFHQVLLIQFGAAEVELEVTFTFTKTDIANNLDNPVKFVMDALQIAKVFDNDRQVVVIMAQKRRGYEDNTQIGVYRHVLTVE